MAIFDPRLAPRVKSPSGLRPVALEQFGGLRLDADPQEIGWSGAIDLLNVDLDQEGRVRQRDGYDNFTTSAAAARYHDIFSFYKSNGTRQLLAGRGSNIDAISSAGAVVATGTPSVLVSGGGTPNQWTAARFGGPSAEVIFLASSLVSTSTTWAVASPLKWTGSAFSDATGMTTPIHLGIFQTDNRLVTSTPESAFSRVRFSDAGAPETFGTNNYVDLTPGDGELIRGLIWWGSSLFVFKETKFFVFYGNSADGSGNPVFNYRTVLSNVGPVCQRAIAAAPDGLYFMGRDGVYRTTGGQPEKISRQIDSLFRGTTPGTYSGSAVNQANIERAAVTWMGDRLYVSVPTGASAANDRVVTFDASRGWSAWSIPASALAPFRISDQDVLMFAYAAGSNHVGRVGSAYTTDDGTVIDSFYRTGFGDLGTPMSEKIVHGWQLDGNGSVGVKVAVNDGSLGTAATATLGGGTGTGDGFRPGRGWRGRNFSVQLEDVSAAWSVSRLTAHVRGERPAATGSP